MASRRIRRISKCVVLRLFNLSIVDIDLFVRRRFLFLRRLTPGSGLLMQRIDWKRVFGRHSHLPVRVPRIFAVSESLTPHKEPNHQHDQQEPANTAPQDGSSIVVAASAPKEEKNQDNQQNGVHMGCRDLCRPEYFKLSSIENDIYETNQTSNDLCDVAASFKATPSCSGHESGAVAHPIRNIVRFHPLKQLPE